MAKEKLYYKIGEACRMLDIQPYVLRYWETEFQVLSPSKSKSGQRVYDEGDLATIRRIKELLYEEGFTIAGAKKKLEAELAEGGEVSGVQASLPTGEEPVEEAPEQTTAADSETAEPASAKKTKQAKVAKPKKVPDSKSEASSRKKSDTKAADTKELKALRAQVDDLKKAGQTALTEAKSLLEYLDSSS